MNKINLAKIKENMDTHEKDVNKSSITETGEAVNVDEEGISQHTYIFFIIIVIMAIVIMIITVENVHLFHNKKDNTSRNNTTNSAVSTVVSTTVPPEISSIDYKLLPTNLDTKSFVIERWVYDPHVDYQPTVITYAFNTEDERGNIEFRHVGRDSVSFHHVEDVEPYVTYTSYSAYYGHYDMYITSDVTIETVFTNTQE